MSGRAERTFEPGQAFDAPWGGLGVLIRRVGPRVVVVLSGTLDGASAHGLDRVLFDLIADQANMHVEIDVSDVGEFDAPGLATLVAAEDRCGRRGSDFCLSGVPFHAEEILRSLTSMRRAHPSKGSGTS